MRDGRRSVGITRTLAAERTCRRPGRPAESSDCSRTSNLGGRELLINAAVSRLIREIFD